MKEIGTVRNLRQTLDSLKSATAGLGTDLFTLASCIQNGEFVSDELEISVTNALSVIGRKQKEIKKQFQELELGEIPKKITEFENVLDDYQKKLEEREKYLDAVRFFLSLHTEEFSINDLLKSRQEAVNLAEFEALETSALKEKIGCFVQLKNAYEEKDNKTKFCLMLKLADQFEAEIIAGIYFGNIKSTKDFDPDPEEPEGGKKVTGSEADQAEKEVAAAFAEAPGENVLDGFEDVVQDKENVKTEAESAEEKTEETVGEDGSKNPEKENTLEDSDEINIPEVGKQEKEISEETTEPETTVPEETAKATATEPDTAENEASSEEKSPESIWESIGIKEPSSLIYKEDPTILHVETSPKAAEKFGVNKLKSDIRKQSPALGFAKIESLVEAYEMGGFTKESLTTWHEDSFGHFDMPVDKLYQLGYLKKYTVDGMDIFYTLSRRGMKAFENKEALSLFNHLTTRKVQFDMDTEEIKDTANSAITRLLCFSCYDRAIWLNPDYKFHKRRDCLGTDCFYMTLPDFADDRQIVFLGVVSEKPEEFLHLHEYIKKMQAEEEQKIYVVLDVTRERARILANWVKQVLETDAPIGYCGYKDPVIYDLSTEEKMKMEDLKKYEETQASESKPEENFEEDIEECAKTYAEEQVEEENEPEEISEEKIEEDLEETCEDISENPDSEEGEEVQNSLGKLMTDPEPLKDPETSQAEMESEEKLSEKDAKASLSYSQLAAIRKQIERMTRPSPASLPSSPDFVAKNNEIYQKMLAFDQQYAATAYVRALSRENDYYKNVYRQLAYALNDPMEGCSYSSDTIFDVYYNEDTMVSDYFVVSAAIRNYFYDQIGYDYSLQQLQDMVSTNPVLELPGVSKIVYLLQQFKAKNHKGMDRYADYREKERENWEQRLEEIKREAKGYYDNFSAGNLKENASHKRFIETVKVVLGTSSDLGQYLLTVAEDDRSMFAMLKEFLADTYVKDGAKICEENIEASKIDRVMDEGWELAAQNMRFVKKTSDLMSSLRMNLFKRIHKVVAVLCNYVFLMESAVSTDEDPALIEYKKNRNILMENITGAIEAMQDFRHKSLEERAGRTVLISTLTELKKRIEGNYKEGNYKYFYINFLRNDKVLLDEDFLPVMDEVLELPEFSLCERILKHCKEPGMEWEARLNDIFSGEDDYGSASLILKYLNVRGIKLENMNAEDISIENAIAYPQKDMENKRKEFIEDLELAQSYGQIDNTVENTKETMIQIMESWFNWANETRNYGFFSKILGAFMEKIHKDAEARAEELNKNLKVYLDKNPDYKQNERVANTVQQIKERIDKQNYTAAEDLLNRLIANDLDMENDILQTDYLQEFLDEYEMNYRKIASAGNTLKSLIYSSKLNKDTKGAMRLIENWPRSAGTGENTLRQLLNALGFQTKSVKAEPSIQGKIESYVISLQKPENGRKSNYKHPIAAFGSEAEEKGFRVVCIFGKTDADRLIDTFKEIGNAKNTLVLLDYALTLSDRRALARKTKKELSGKTFAVIDRVVLIYLAKHYTETAINRMLMYVTMPFASYQPYIAKSSDLMPQEIFIGRKNELEKIESPTGVNLVYGGRQLGKTALLRMAKKDLDMDENGDRAIVVSVYKRDYKEAARAVSAALYDEGILKKENITEDWNIIARDIKNRLYDKEDPIPYFLLMIDEADVFIESCEEIEYQPFEALKEIQSIGAGRFKFVVAGLRNIIRFKRAVALGKNSMLAHLDSLTVKPFKTLEARELLEVPLSYLGFRFPKENETDMLVSTIFGTTNYFPGLIQLYCTKLIEAMKRDYAGYSESETPPYYMKKEHIKKVLAEQSLQQDIREKFEITLKVDDDDYYYIIALLVAYHYHENKSQNGCDAEELLELANGFSIGKLTKLDKEKISALMEEMAELNVLQNTGDGHYRFTRHSFCQMMGTKTQLDDELLKYMED